MAGTAVATPIDIVSAGCGLLKYFRQRRIRRRSESLSVAFAITKLTPGIPGSGIETVPAST